MKRSILLLLLIINIKSFTLDFWEKIETEELIEKMVKEMNNHELLGQMFMISYPESQITPHVLDWIRNKNLGGIKIFGWNSKKLEALINSITNAQKSSQNNRFKIPLFVATDQEGGWTQHIKLNTSETIGNLGITATLSPLDSYYTGYHIGNELKSIGINLNFAPIVDMYTDVNNFTIGPRSFSDDPKLVTLFSLAFFKGQQEAGIIATAKHFPGHGATTIDSHSKLPIINIDLLKLESRELIPYKTLIYENIPIIMSGHLAYPKITDEKNIPASSSKTIIKKLLRDKLQYKNLILTDDLIMNATRYNNETIFKTIERIIRTTTDILLISLNEELQNNIYSFLLNLMQVDSEIKENIIEANRRILKIKLLYLKQNSNRVPLYPQLSKALQFPLNETKEFFNQTTLRGITKIKSTQKLDKNKKTLLISPYLKMFQEGRKIFKNANTYTYNYYPINHFDLDKQKEMESLVKEYTQVIFTLATTGSLKYLETLKTYKDKISIIVCLTPQHIRKLKWPKNIVIVYGTTSLTFKAGLLTLTGDFNPKGVIPLNNFKY